MIKNWLAVQTKETNASINRKRRRLAKTKSKIDCLQLQVTKARNEIREEESKSDVNKELEELRWLEFIGYIVDMTTDYYIMITENGVCTENREMLHWLRGSSVPLVDGGYIPPHTIQDEIHRLGIKFESMRMRVHANIERTIVNDAIETAYSTNRVEVVGLNSITLHDDLFDDNFVNELFRAPGINSIERNGQSAETYLDCVAIHFEVAVADTKE